MKNTPESILEIQHSYTSGGLIYTSNYARICTPNQTTAESGSDIFDGVKIEELGDDANVWPGMRPNLVFSAGLQTRTGGDRRVEMNPAWEYGGQEFKASAQSTRLGPKFWCPGMRDSYDSNNYKVFRHADAVLMMAECWCMKGEPGTDQALSQSGEEPCGIAEFPAFKSWSARSKRPQRSPRADRRSSQQVRPRAVGASGTPRPPNPADYETVRNAILPLAKNTTRFPTRRWSTAHMRSTTRSMKNTDFNLKNGTL